jgi:hypothetical protein
MFQLVLLFNNSIVHLFTVNPPFNGSIDGSFCYLLEIFGSDFLKIISAHFGKPSSPTRTSTVFLVSMLSSAVRTSAIQHPRTGE